MTKQQPPDQHLTIVGSVIQSLWKSNQLYNEHAGEQDAPGLTPPGLLGPEIALL